MSRFFLLGIAWLILAVTEIVLALVFAATWQTAILILVAWCGGVAWTLVMQAYSRA